MPFEYISPSLQKDNFCDFLIVFLRTNFFLKKKKKKSSLKDSRSSATIALKGKGPVVQSVVSLTSSLIVEMLTVLVSIISNSQVFLLKNVSSFCKCKGTHIFF